MTHGCVTLDEVFAAAGVRAASLVPETSGYLALAIGDATSRLPFAIEERSVMLTTEGNVGITRRGEMLPPRQAARGLREMLSRLLAASTGTVMPALAHACKTREESERGVDTVVEEIEAALIPVNRAAARRALARLARETIKAKEAGKLKPRAARPPVVEAPRPEEAKPVEALPEPQPTVAQQLVVEATTPAPRETAPRTPAPRTPTPAPVAAAPRLELPPPPPEADPTPTVLGMGVVEIHGPVPEAESERHPEPARAAASHHVEEPALVEVAPVEVAPVEVTPVEVAPDEAETTTAKAAPLEVAPDEDETTTAVPAITNEELLTDLGEPAVLMQPSEEPEDAFELARRPRPIAEPMTPPFALEAEPAPRELPATRAGVREPAPRHHERSSVHTRADDLLARFGASCIDDAGMREAAACLRRIAGIDPTPPPPRVEIRLAPPPEPAPYEALARIPQDAETPILPRVRARRARYLPSLGLTLVVLVVGLAGGGALVRLRPELFGVGAHPTGAHTLEPGPEPMPEPADARKESAAEAPTTTTPPAGALAPSFADRLGGTRAERGTTERAR